MDKRVSLIERIRDGDPWERPYACQEAAEEAATALTEALAIARELARLACCMDAPAPGSIGEQVAKLDALEARIGGA